MNERRDWADGTGLDQTGLGAKTKKECKDRDPRWRKEIERHEEKRIKICPEKVKHAAKSCARVTLQKFPRSGR